MAWNLGWLKNSRWNSCKDFRKLWEWLRYLIRVTLQRREEPRKLWRTRVLKMCKPRLFGRAKKWLEAPIERRLGSTRSSLRNISQKGWKKAYASNVERSRARSTNARLGRCFWLMIPTKTKIDSAWGTTLGVMMLQNLLLKTRVFSMEGGNVETPRRSKRLVEPKGGENMWDAHGLLRVFWKIFMVVVVLQIRINKGLIVNWVLRFL